MRKVRKQLSKGEGILKVAKSRLESGLARSSASQTSLGKTRPLLLALRAKQTPPPPFFGNQKTV